MTFLESPYKTAKEKILLLSESKSAAYVTGKMTSLPERLVRCIWYDQLIDRSRLKTADGRRIEIYSQGEWNCGAGPDFAGGMFRIEGEDTLQGDIEIHVRAADWRRHGHHRNPEYCGVALHVAMWNDSKEQFISNSRGEPIPQVILSDCLVDDLEAIECRIDMENYPYNTDSRTGLCCSAALKEPQRLPQLLDMAGRERLFIKTRRFQRELKNRSFDDVLYRAIMEGLGYRHNKAPFRRLADIVPLKSVLDIKKSSPKLDSGLILQSIYFGASGLFSNIGVQLWDSETRAYCEALNEAWDSYNRFIGRDRMHKKDWTVHGVRPANFPLRRMAGLSRLMAEKLGAGPAEPVLAFASKIKKCDSPKQMKKLLDEIEAFFTVEADRYWSHHIVPGGKYLETAPTLIGEPLAATLVFNIIIPVLMCRAADDNDTVLRDRLIDAFSTFPGLGDNRIAKLMCHRLWGSQTGDRKLLAREINRQALLQLFFDFCDENIQNCKNCSFPKMLDISGSLSDPGS